MLYVIFAWIVRIDGSIDTLDKCYSLEVINGDVIIGGNYGNNLFLARLNGLDGSIVWQKILSFSGYGRSNIKVVRIDPLDNNIAVAGTVYPFPNSSTPCGYVAKFRTDNGNLIWQYIDQDNQSCSNGGFISSERYGFSDLLIGYDNHYYAVGSDFEIWFDGVFSNSARYIVKVNRSTGQRIFRSSPGGYMYRRAKSFDNSSVIAVGHGDRGEVQKFLTSDGSIMWSNTYSTSSKIYAIDKLQNGNIVVGGLKNNDFYIGLLDDNNGNIIGEWTKNGAGNNTDILSDIISIGNEIYATGYLNNGYTGNDAYVVKLNQLLNVVWERTFNNIPNSDDYFLSIKKTLDNKIIVGGTVNYPITGKDFMIYKIDPTTGDTVYTFRYDYNALTDIAFDFKEINDTLYACGISYSTTNNADIVVIKWIKSSNMSEEVEKREFILKANKIIFLAKGLVEIYASDGRIYKRLTVREN
ncbi:MAG: hypothetical protein ABIL37_00880 [candidate division WOR-3 bacterium]